MAERFAVPAVVGSHPHYHCPNLRMIRLRLLVPAAAGLFVPLLAAAHTGPLAHPASGFMSGIAHPFMGVDHLLAMLAVGMWAGQMGGKATWRVPASFIVLMAIGSTLAMLGAPLPALESGILASLVVFGLLLATALRLPAMIAAAGVGLFALFHGAAHGVEVPLVGNPVAYVVGFMLATGVLHVAGIRFTWLCDRSALPVPRLAGAAIAGVGIALSFGEAGFW